MLTTRDIDHQMCHTMLSENETHNEHDSMETKLELLSKGPILLEK